MDTARAYLIEQLTPLLPATWKLLPYFTNLDVQTQTVAMLVLESVQRAPEAPNSTHEITFTLQLREPKTDPAKREDSLDESLDDLIFALDTIPNTKWTKAERVLHGTPGAESLSFDISITVYTNKKVEI
jgi:hypothetical protein